MPRVVDREARRADLVAAAAAVFAERGVAKSSVSDIVGAAGVTSDEVRVATTKLMSSR